MPIFRAMMSLVLVAVFSCVGCNGGGVSGNKKNTEEKKSEEKKSEEKKSDKPPDAGPSGGPMN